MATLSNIINLVACGLGAALGTGTKGCKPFLKKVKDIWIVPQGFALDGTRDLDATYAKELQADGKLLVVKGIVAFTDNSSEDQIETLEDGTKQVTTLGLYEFLVQFVNGLYFHSALTSLNSFGQYDFIFVDTAGNILGTKSSTGSLKGFTAGMVQGQRLTFPTDTTGEREGLGFQLLERSELDENYIFIQKQSEFDPRTLQGVNQVTLSFVNTPAASDTTLTIKAVNTQDGKAFTGADFSNFQLKVNGTVANPTAGDDSATDGTYVLTIAALASADSLETSLYDVANSRGAIELDSSLYKSNTISSTVA